MRLRAQTYIACAFALVWLFVPPRAVFSQVGDTVPVVDFVPRHTLVVEPFGLYVEPAAIRGRAPLGATSMAALRDTIQRAIAADPRFALSERSLLELVIEHNRDPQQADLRALAEQNARAGLTSFRQYEMASAISELERAADGFGRTGGAYVATDALADVYFYLALAWLQIGEQNPDRDAEAGVRARAAFSALVRLDPSRALDPNAYPEYVLAPWREAWAEHVVNRGQELGLRLDEARWISERLNRDLLVRLVAVVGVDGAWLRIQAYDRASDSFVLNEVIPLDAAQAAPESAVEMQVSDLAACLEPVVRELPRARPERHADLIVGYSAGTFLQTPTRSRFFAQGVNVEGVGVLGRSAGMYGGLRLLFAVTDPRGDLISRADTVQMAFGFRVEHRIGRMRFNGGTGVQFMRSSPIRASRSYWCRVSEGEPEQFDDERSCLASDVVDRPATAQFGLDFRTGMAVELVEPLSLLLQGDIGFFLVPLDGRVLDLPIGASLSFDYRF